MESSELLTEERRFFLRLYTRDAASSKKLTWKESVQELLCFLDSVNLKTREGSTNLELVRYLTPIMYVTLNMLCYLPLNMPQTYRGVAALWYWVLWLRIDFIVEELNQLGAFLCVIWGVIGSVFLILVYCLVSFRVRKQPSKRISWLVSLVLSVICTVFPVPVTGLLVADVCKSLGSYNGWLSMSTSTSTALVSVCALSIYAALILAKETAAIEILCHPSLWSFSARTCLKESLIELGSLIVPPFLYFLVSPTSAYAYYATFAILHGFCSLYFFIKLPLYNELSNMIQTCRYLVLAWSAVAMLLGLFFTSDFLAVIMTIVVSPAIFVAVDSSWHALYMQNLDTSLQELRIHQSHSKVQVAIRAALLTDQEETVLAAFKVMRTAPNSNLKCISLIESNYTLQILGNESLARFQLSRAVQAKGSLVDSFLEFKMWRRLDSSWDLEEVNYLRFMDGLSKAEETDELLCRELAEFWNELGSQDPQRKKLNSLFSNIYEKVDLCKVLYHRLIKNSPENTLVIDSYSSFLRDILLRPAKAMYWDSKSMIIKEAMMRVGADTELLFSNADTCILLADLSYEDPGKIIYHNDLASAALQYDELGLDQLHIQAIIPPPYSSFHQKNIWRFLTTRDKATINHPQILPLLTAKGYLVEFHVKIAVTSVGGPAMLLVGFRKAENKREIALVSLENTIYAHSEDFPKLLGSENPNLRSVSIYDCCPGLSKLVRDEEIVHLRLNPPLYGTLCSVHYNTKVVRKLLLFKNETSTVQFTSIREAKRRSLRPFMRSLASSDGLKPGKSLFEKPGVTFSAVPDVFSVREQDKDGQVMASSIASVGNKLSCTSSFSGNSTFSGSVLGSRIKLGIRRTYTLLAVIVTLAIALMIAGNIAISVYLITTTGDIISNSISIELALRIVHCTRVAGQGRFLDLTNAGFFSISMTSDVKNVISQSVDLMSTMESTIWDAVHGLSSSPFVSMYTDDVVPTWELVGGAEVSHKRNLFNAVQIFIDHSRLILGYNITELSVSNPSVFYVIRNGMKGETIAAMEKSLDLYRSMEEDQIKQNVSAIMYLVISVFLTLTLALVLSTPVITSLQTHIAQVSNIFTKLPLTQCLEHKKRALDRLRDLYKVELEHGLEQARRSPTAYVIYKPVWMLVICVLGFFSLYAIMYIVIYVLQTSHLTSFVQGLPTLMQDYALRYATLIDMWTWATEAIFMDSAWPLTTALPGFSQQLNPLQEIDFTIQFMSTINYQLFLMAQAGKIVFTDAHNMIYIFQTNYTTPMLRQGLRVGIMAYLSDISLCATYRGVTSQMYTDCGNLYNAAREFVNISSDVLTYVEEDFRASVSQQAWQINYYLLASSFVGLLFLSFVLLPLLYQSYQHVNRMIRLVSLIPANSFLQPIEMKKTGDQNPQIYNL